MERSHQHDHGHSHAIGHGHSHGPASFDRAFAIGTVLNVGIVVSELIFGYFANSLALMADAAHNVSDVAGLLLAWGAAWLSRRAPTAELEPFNSHRSNPPISGLAQVERDHILHALEASNWIIGGRNGAAERLGMKRTSLVYRMKKLRISRPLAQTAKSA